MFRRLLDAMARVRFALRYTADRHTDFNRFLDYYEHATRRDLQTERFTLLQLLHNGTPLLQAILADQESSEDEEGDPENTPRNTSCGKRVRTEE